MKIILKLNSIFTLGLMAIMSFSCQKEVKHDGYTITGTVKGIDTGWVKIIKLNMVERQKVEVLDSVTITNGSFSFQGKTDAQDMATLQLNDQYTAEFFLENTVLNIELDLSTADQNKRLTPAIKGSAMFDEVLKQRAKRDSVYNHPKFDYLKEVSEAYQAARKNKNQAKMDELLALMDSDDFQKLSTERSNSLTKLIYDFVEQNPGSPVAPNIMGFQYTEGRMTRENLKKYYEIYKGDAKKTAYFQFFHKVHDEVFNRMGVGATVPDFTLTMLGGEQLTLSKVEGKYILIDFWASWCVPCRASFPHLKELYKQYKDKGFEVVAIGTADQEDKWRKAIDDDQTPWLHVYDNNTGSGNMYGPVAQKYSVPHLPTTFLVDDKGTIVLRQPQKEELDKKLAELFKTN